MKTEWFDDLAERLLREFDDDRETSQLVSNALMRISRLAYGEIDGDDAMPEDIAAQFAQKRVADALQRWANMSSSVSRGHGKYVKNVPAEKFQSPIDFASHKETVPALELNSASKKDLEALSTIGPISASRIVQHREKHGPFQRFENLQSVYKIKPEQIQVLIENTFLEYSVPYSLLPASAEDFFPTFEELLTASWELALKSEPSYGMHVLEQLRRVEEDLPKFKSRPYIRLSTLEEAKDELSLSSQDLGSQLMDADFGRILFDSQYPAFVAKLLRTATTSIRLTMFLFRFEDEAEYPTDELVAELIAAAQRGVDVKVILNIDEDTMGEEGSVNIAIGNYLTENRIPVRYDKPEVALHSKVLVVDAQHIVVGSHNWTAGSFFNYDDTSAYLSSGGCAGVYMTMFDQFWDELEDVE